MGISNQDVRVEQVAVADTTQFTVETGTYAEIVHSSVCNESAAAVTFSFYAPNPTAAAGATNYVIKDKTILAGQTDLLPELLGKRYAAGTVFKTTAGTATALNLHMSLVIRTVN